MISEEYKSAFSHRFKHFITLIINRGLAKDQNEVAKLMNAAAQAVSQMMKGERLATVEQIDKLSQATGLNANWLLTGTEPLFLEKEEPVEDIIVMITKAVNEEQIPAEKGQIIIEYIREFQNKVEAKDEEINKLTNEVIDLMRVIKKF